MQVGYLIALCLKPDEGNRKARRTGALQVDILREPHAREWGPQHCTGGKWGACTDVQRAATV